jgi:tetratricopeptide (TPR) repeat protein
MLFVERSSQRQGVGRSLMSAAKAYALTRQPPVRALTVGSAPNAIDAYRRMGFVLVSREQILKGIRYIPMELEIGCHTSAPVMTPPLEPPDSFHLNAAQGWLELGNSQEANEDLERIAPLLRAHPDVLGVRWHVYAHAQKWDACVDLAEAIIKLDPDRAEAWIHRSFALHELKRTQEAFDQLLHVADRFRKVWTIPYNLACYCAQLGRLDQCQEWFKKAMDIDGNAVKQAGIDDPDLKPLWDSMSSTR